MSSAVSWPGGIGIRRHTAQAEATDKWRYKDLKGQLLSPHSTCQEGKKAQPERKRRNFSPQDLTGGGLCAALGAGAAAHPFVSSSLATEKESWEEKYFV